MERVSPLFICVRSLIYFFVSQPNLGRVIIKRKLCVKFTVFLLLLLFLQFSNRNICLKKSGKKNYFLLKTYFKKLLCNVLSIRFFIYFYVKKREAVRRMSWSNCLGLKKNSRQYNEWVGARGWGWVLLVWVGDLWLRLGFGLW